MDHPGNLLKISIAEGAFSRMGRALETCILENHQVFLMVRILCNLHE